MWLFNDFPSKQVAEKYGFSPSEAWLQDVGYNILVPEPCRPAARLKHRPVEFVVQVSSQLGRSL